MIVKERNYYLSSLSQFRSSSGLLLYSEPSEINVAISQDNSPLRQPTRRTQHLVRYERNLLIKNASDDVLSTSLSLSTQLSVLKPIGCEEEIDVCREMNRRKHQPTVACGGIVTAEVCAVVFNEGISLRLRLASAKLRVFQSGSCLL